MTYEQFIKEIEPFNIEPFDENILAELWGENCISFDGFETDHRYECFMKQENLINHVDETADLKCTVGRLIFSYLEDNYSLFVIDIYDNGQCIQEYHIQPYLGAICKCWY